MAISLLGLQPTHLSEASEASFGLPCGRQKDYCLSFSPWVRTKQNVRWVPAYHPSDDVIQKSWLLISFILEIKYAEILYNLVRVTFFLRTACSTCDSRKRRLTTTTSFLPLHSQYSNYRYPYFCIAFYFFEE